MQMPRRKLLTGKGAAFVTSLAITGAACSFRVAPSASVSLQQSQREVVDVAAHSCTSIREYRAVFRFLESEAAFAKDLGKRRQIADRVAQGCSGAASRFIRAYLLLGSAKLPTASAVRAAVDVALMRDDAAETFLAVFAKSYARDGLDLDVASSLRLAVELAREFDGSYEDARRDFGRLADFCVATPSLGLPRPACAAFALRAARIGESLRVPVAEEFLRGFAFATTSGIGPNLTTSDGLVIVERVLRKTPLGLGNFIDAYQFAADKDGLNLDRASSLKFAERIAAFTKDDRAATTPEASTE